MTFAAHFAKYADWNLYCWMILFAWALTIEMLGIFHGAPDATLTYLIRTTVPAWVRAMLLGWLVWHFLIA